MSSNLTSSGRKWWYPGSTCFCITFHSDVTVLYGCLNKPMQFFSFQLVVILNRAIIANYDLNYLKTAALMFVSVLK